MRNRVIFLILFPLFAHAQSPVLVVKNVTVVDVREGKVKKRQTVVVTGNKISYIGKKAVPPNTALTVDATGKYLIPGLWDMHIHALTDKRYTWVFPLLIANGVTCVREMGHNLKIEDAKEIVQQVLEGKVVGPRFGAVTAAILDGPGTKLNVAVPVATEEEGRTWVSRYKEQGIDFIKPYNLLHRAVYLAIVDECKRQKIPFAGHVPFSMTAAEVSDLGQRSIEHHTDVVLSCAANEATVRADLLDSLKLQPAGMVPMIEVRAAAAYDGQKANQLFARFAKNKTHLCPTLVLSGRSQQTPAEREADFNLVYIPKRLQEQWRLQAAVQMQRMPTAEDRRRRAEMRKQVTTAMIKQGVPLLVGTDVPNPYTYPGFSLHDELGLLVEAGLSPAAALKVATIDAAHFFGKGKELGSVAKGKLADLVLLDANPLENIANTKKTSAVIANGRLFTRLDLDKFLNDVRAMQDKEPQSQKIKTP